MMRLRLLPAFLVLLSLPLPSHAAPDVDTPECTDETYTALAREQRTYRGVVYGSKKAADLPVNSILYDKDGDAWIKKAKNSWHTVPGFGQESSTGVQASGWQNSDSEMDDKKDVPTRKGILEAKRTATSDLIPALTQSLRALQCRLRAVCELAYASQTAEEEEDKLKVQPVGCIEFELPVLKACSTRDGVSPAFIAADACNRAADALFAQESNILNLSVAYDGSYRTVAQFSGMFEGFLSEFRFPLLNPLWQTVRVLGGIKNIPCFLSQCEE